MESLTTFRNRSLTAGKTDWNLPNHSFRARFRTIRFPVSLTVVEVQRAGTPPAVPPPAMIAVYRAAADDAGAEVVDDFGTEVVDDFGTGVVND